MVNIIHKRETCFLFRSHDLHSTFLHLTSGLKQRSVSCHQEKNTDTYKNAEMHKKEKKHKIIPSNETFMSEIIVCSVTKF